MATSKRQVNIFLASPGDLKEERKRARIVVEEVNTLVGEKSDIRFELVGWEDTVSVFGRPQATINRELERCELFVGLMWKKWGTAPSKSGPYSSGFEEEFRTSVARRSTSGSPEISLFFKEVSPDLLGDPGEDLRKVIAFKKELIDEKYILFEEFSAEEELERKLRRCLFNYIHATRDREELEVAETDQPPAKAHSVEPQEKPILSSSEEKFLHQLLLKTKSNPLKVQDVARLRLLAARLLLQGNDELALGAHDANILYQSKEELDLDSTESNALAVAGLSHLRQENVPLWHWLKSGDFALALHSVFGSSSKKIGALIAMTLLKTKISTEGNFDRNFFISLWLSEEAEAEEKVSALKYLATCGSHEDISAIKSEAHRNDSRTSEAAISAVVLIALRSGKEEALREIYALEPSSVPDEAVSKISVGLGSIDTALLRSGLSLKTKKLRRVIVEELFRRSEISTEESEALLADEDLAIRRLAIDQLTRAGKPLQDERVKSLLTSQGGNLVSVRDDEEWRSYGRDRLRAMTKATLKRMINDESIFEIDVLLTYLEKDMKKSKSVLKELISSQFKDQYAGKLAALMKVVGSSSDLAVQTKDLESFVTSGHTAKALDLLASRGDAADISVVRAALESKKIGLTEKTSDYLRRFGEWRDIPLIIEALSKNRRTSLLTIDSAPVTSSAASTIASLGDHRLRELLKITMPDTLLARVISKCSDNEFSALDEEDIFTLLNSSSDLVRKSSSLKCVKCLPKAKNSLLLSAYIGSDQYRYYNVIHWLDLAASLSVTTARRIAAHKLGEISR